MMDSESFRAEARGQAVKSAGQINTNATKMRNIKVPAPPLAEQNRLVARGQKLEQPAAEAQAGCSSFCPLATKIGRAHV